MNTKENRRLAHVMKYRKQVFHNLFWKDDWSVYRSNVSGVTACNRFLFKGKHDDHVKNWGDYKNICDSWDNNSYYTRWRKETCVAVVNREEHFVLISSVADNGNFGLNIKQATPSNYRIYYYEGLITNPRITDKKYRNKMIRGIAAYLIKRFVEMNSWVFKLAYTDRWYCGDYAIKIDNKLDNLNSFDFNKVRKKYYCISDIFDFEFNVHNSNKFTVLGDIPNSIKNEHILSKVNIYLNSSWNDVKYSLTRNEIPTINEIVNNTFLDTKHLDIVNKKYFYSVLCRGTLFPHSIKEVDYYWNTSIPEYNNKLAEDAYKFDDGKLKEWITDYRAHNGEPKWQDCIFAFYKDYVKNITEINYRNREKSKKNFHDALDAWNKEHYGDLNSQLSNWRKHNYSSSINSVVKYMSWHDSNTKISGYWYKQTTYITNNRFQNTQLRLSTDNKNIETSRYCAVPLQSAIMLYGVFKGVTKVYGKTPVNDVKVDFSDKNIRVGAYQLLNIKYTEKVTDDDIDLGFKDWIVQVGCHRLWITDFIDFVHYYRLEKDFDIE